MLQNKNSYLMKNYNPNKPIIIINIFYHFRTLKDLVHNRNFKKKNQKI